ncbi:hypothetical protein H9P43_006904 [Blastocladiella emersonii ATCC 22665]|nr:hypothetical protein H9P43_006868 [Blastocladiella emersonii ATCC 22665]KAI9175543.1 hypothetical protein H9P43_006904 [Blastocladiella emersonii ATCC 22665]
MGFFGNLAAKAISAGAAMVTSAVIGAFAFSLPEFDATTMYTFAQQQQTAPVTVTPVSVTPVTVHVSDAGSAPTGKVAQQATATGTISATPVKSSTVTTVNCSSPAAAEPKRTIPVTDNKIPVTDSAVLARTPTGSAECFVSADLTRVTRVASVPSDPTNNTVSASVTDGLEAALCPKSDCAAATRALGHGLNELKTSSPNTPARGPDTAIDNHAGPTTSCPDTRGPATADKNQLALATSCPDATVNNHAGPLTSRPGAPARIVATTVTAQPELPTSSELKNSSLDTPALVLTDTTKNLNDNSASPAPVEPAAPNTERQVSSPSGLDSKDANSHGDKAKKTNAFLNTIRSKLLPAGPPREASPAAVPLTTCSTSVAHHAPAANAAPHAVASNSNIAEPTTTNNNPVSLPATVADSNTSEPARLRVDADGRIQLPANYNPLIHGHYCDQDAVSFIGSLNGPPGRRYGNWLEDIKSDADSILPTPAYERDAKRRADAYATRRKLTAVEDALARRADTMNKKFFGGEPRAERGHNSFNPKRVPTMEQTSDNWQRGNRSKGFITVRERLVLGSFEGDLQACPGTSGRRGYTIQQQFDKGKIGQLRVERDGDPDWYADVLEAVEAITNKYAPMVGGEEMITHGSLMDFLGVVLRTSSGGPLISVTALAAIVKLVNKYPVVRDYFAHAPGSVSTSKGSSEERAACRAMIKSDMADLDAKLGKLFSKTKHFATAQVAEDALVYLQYLARITKQLKVHAVQSKLEAVTGAMAATAILHMARIDPHNKASLKEHGLSAGFGREAVAAVQYLLEYTKRTVKQ